MAQLSHGLIKEAELTTEDIEYIGIDPVLVYVTGRMGFWYMLIILISMMYSMAKEMQETYIIAGFYRE